MEKSTSTFNTVIPNFSQAIFKQSAIDSVEFLNCNFKGADLSESDFFDVLISQCNLERADLAKTILVETTLEKVNLKKANLRFTSWGDTSYLFDSELREATWQDINDYPLRRNTIMPDGEVVTDEI